MDSVVFLAVVAYCSVFFTGIVITVCDYEDDNFPDYSPRKWALVGILFILWPLTLLVHLICSLIFNNWNWYKKNESSQTLANEESSTLG